jgi:exonuclease III
MLKVNIVNFLAYLWLFFIPTVLSVMPLFNSLIPELSISAVNCNSLNMSASSSNLHKLKIYGITSLKTDIILLSDTRLANNPGVLCLNAITNSFLVNPYGAYTPIFNSTQNKRGVGILLRNACDFSVLQLERDPKENILLARLCIKGNENEFIVGAVYGPNRYEPAFFNNLRRLLDRLGDWPVVLGGDWNCSHSCLPRDANIDILNMANPPNLRHSNLLKTLCEDKLLTDPYRCRYPNRIDFTYTSSASV